MINEKDLKSEFIVSKYVKPTDKFGVYIIEIVNAVIYSSTSFKYYHDIEELKSRCYLFILLNFHKCDENKGGSIFSFLYTLARQSILTSMRIVRNYKEDELLE